MANEIEIWGFDNLTEVLLIGCLLLIIALTLLCVFGLFKLRKYASFYHSVFNTAFDEQRETLSKVIKSGDSIAETQQKAFLVSQKRHELLTNAFDEQREALSKVIKSGDSITETQQKAFLVSQKRHELLTNAFDEQRETLLKVIKSGDSIAETQQKAFLVSQKRHERLINAFDEQRETLSKVIKSGDSIAETQQKAFLVSQKRHELLINAFDEQTAKLSEKISNINSAISHVTNPQDILKLKFFVKELHDLTVKISDNFYTLTQQYQNVIEPAEELQTENLTPRSVFWTPELILQFWSAVSNSRLDELSFSNGASAALIRIIKPIVKKDAVILDFGGGNGTLTNKLRGLGFSCDIYDPSAERFSCVSDEDQHSGAFSSTTKITSNRYDLIIACEVIEHLVVGAFSNAIFEMRRMLKPGGVLLVTTPNNEDLELGYAIDPVSGRYFHRWQHVRQFNEKTLSNILSLYGLQPKAVATLEISNSSHVKKLSDYFSALSNDVSNSAREPVKMHGTDGANLVFLAQKPMKPTIENDMPASNLSFLNSGSVKLDVSIEHVEGYMYRCPVSDLSGFASKTDQPFCSQFVLLEDDEPLTYQNAPHAYISDIGLGSYSHWGDYLYFSSSDNSPVDKNGRSYVLSLSHWTDIE